MADDVIDRLGAVVGRLRVLAAEDEQFRQNLRFLAQALLAITEPAKTHSPLDVARTDSELPPTAPSAAQEAIAVDVAAASAVVEQAPQLPSAQPDRPPITFGLATPVKEPVSTTAAPTPVEPEVTDGDLPVIENRLRLKSEGARWAASRRRQMAHGADFRTDIEPLDREIIERAKGLPDGFLWMCHPSGLRPRTCRCWTTCPSASAPRQTPWHWYAAS